MALYKGSTKISGVGKGFEPTNQGTTGQVLKKSGNSYGWADESGGGNAQWGNITGTLSNQTDLNNALGAKADATNVNTKTFTLTTGSDLTTAQAAYDWYAAGGNPIIIRNGISHSLVQAVGTEFRFNAIKPQKMNSSDGFSYVSTNVVLFTISNGTVTSIGVTTENTSIYGLDAFENYSTPYTPLFQGSPATKKYVDDSVGAIDEFEPGNTGTAGQVLKKTANGYEWDNETPGGVTSVNGQTGAVTVNDVKVGATAPSNPTVGTAWYDGVNGVLKMYNGVNWIEQLQNLVILQYGSSTWADFTAAYSKNAIVYCLASSNSSNPGTGKMTRLAFMAYVNDATNPTEVQFQYYRSTTTKSKTSHVDEVYAYTLKPTSGGTWTFDVRKTGPTVLAGTGISTSWSSATSSLTINNSLPFNPDNSGTTGQVIKKTAGGYEWANESGGGGGGIQLAANSPINLAYIWAGYEDDYANVSTYDATTAYLVIEGNNPGGGWQPSANTVGYYPLNSTDTYFDQSGNGRDLSSSYGSVAYGTYHGVDCAYFNVGELTGTFSAVSFTELTTNVWYYQDATPNNDNATITWFENSGGTGEMGPIMANGWPDSKYGLAAYATTSSVGTSSAVTLTAGWHNIVQTYDGTTHTLYVDGVSVATLSFTLNWSSVAKLRISRDSDLDRSIKGCLSEAIFEKKCWSATEVLNYFNNTKSTYGIN